MKKHQRLHPHPLHPLPRLGPLGQCSSGPVLPNPHWAGLRGEPLGTQLELEKMRKTSETGGAGWGDGS